MLIRKSLLLIPLMLLLISPIYAQDNEPPKEKKPVQLSWQLKKGDTFYQGITVTQIPSYRVQGLGLTFRSKAQYSILSQFIVDKKNADGSLVVSQKIVTTKLDQADAMMAKMLQGPLRNLIGQEHRIELSSKMLVTKLAGFKGKLNVMPVNLMGGQGFMMGSLIDKDGWKELTQATFFVPDGPLQTGEPWKRAMTHAWGPLGSWRGNAVYLYRGNKGDLHQVDYSLQLRHVPPIGGGAGLPFQIAKANFVPRIAGGSLVFDAAKGRVIAAEERFRVQGKVAVQLGCANVVMDVDEDQLFQIKIYSENPLKDQQTEPDTKPGQ